MKTDKSAKLTTTDKQAEPYNHDTFNLVAMPTQIINKEGSEAAKEAVEPPKKHAPAKGHKMLRRSLLL